MDQAKPKLSAERAAERLIQLVSGAVDANWGPALELWIAKAPYTRDSVRPLFDGTAQRQAVCAAVALNIGLLRAKAPPNLARSIEREVRQQVPCGEFAIHHYRCLWAAPDEDSDHSRVLMVAASILERSKAGAVLALNSQVKVLDPFLLTVVAGIVIEAGRLPLRQAVDENFEVVPSDAPRSRTRRQGYTGSGNAGAPVDARLRAVWVVPLLVIAAVFIRGVGGFNPSTSDPVASSAQQESREALSLYGLGESSSQTIFQPAVNAIPPEPLPPNGKLVRYDFFEEAVAPIRIETRGLDQNYFCKLTRNGERTPAITVFIRGGRSASFEVPVGIYELKYAVGRDWYGEDFLFGTSTGYYEAEEDFECTRSGNSISGYSIQLYAQRNGNLKTAPISASEW